MGSLDSSGLIRYSRKSTSHAEPIIVFDSRVGMIRMIWGEVSSSCCRPSAFFRIRLGRWLTTSVASLNFVSKLGFGSYQYRSGRAR